MSEKFKSILDKYNPSDIFKTVEENYDVTRVRAGSFVKIDPKLLNSEPIKTEIVSKKGIPYFSQLDLLGKNGTILYVTALKAIRPSSGYLSEAPPSIPEEADLVVHKVPGLYSSPITVPVAILTTDTLPGDIMQKPIPDEFSAKDITDKGTELDNEYNKGKQPKGTRKNGGNN